MNLQLKSVFQNVPAGLYVGCVDEENSGDSVLLMINDAICQMTGFSRREVSDAYKDRFVNLIYPEDQQKYQDAIRELNEFPQSVTLNYRLMKKAGGFIRVKDSLRSVRHEDGTMGIYACVTQEQVKEVQPLAQTSRIEVQTFGRFNVLVDGHPMIFHSEKAKELLALLIDRKGYYVSNREIIVCLWEDELVDKVTQSRCRKVVFNLKKTLELYGLEDIIESNIKGYRRLNTQLIDCDLYKYLSGEEKYAHLFQGSYMDEYSWAEMTLSNLIFEAEERKKNVK